MVLLINLLFLKLSYLHDNDKILEVDGVNDNLINS